MPEIYEVENHPLLDGVDHVGKVYVGYVGTDKSSVRDDFELERTLKCPQGGVDEWEAQGEEQSPRYLADCSKIVYRDVTTSEWRIPVSQRPSSV
jgi:hypothetical protein